MKSMNFRPFPHRLSVADWIIIPSNNLIRCLHFLSHDSRCSSLASQFKSNCCQLSPTKILTSTITARLFDSRFYLTTQVGDASRIPQKPPYSPYFFYEFHPTRLQLKERLGIYCSLSKVRLSLLVVLTTLGGYYFPSSGAFCALHLVATCLGTALCSFSANTFNQLLEVPFDCQMKRTRSRSLPQQKISLLHAFSFGLSTGVLGVSMLSGVGWAAGILGFSNIILYTAIYTPMKRISTWNTAIGAIVGAIPPLIGSMAADPSSFGNPSTFILPMVLFAWQFPHFNSLSWNLRNDYAKAGYYMLSAVDPSRNSLSAVKYSFLLFAMSLIAYSTGSIDSEIFLLDSSILNTALTYFAIKFHLETNQKSARKLFLFSLIYLPIYMILLILHRKPTDTVIRSFDEAHCRDSSEQEGIPCINPME